MRPQNNTSSTRGRRPVERRIYPLRELAAFTDDKGAELGGYLLRWASTYTVLDTEETHTERYAPGSFDRTVADGRRGSFVADDPLGRGGVAVASRRAGTLRLAVDEVGLRFDATLHFLDGYTPEATAARTVASAYKRGDLDAVGLELRILRDAWPSGSRLRLVTEAQIVGLFVPLTDDETVTPRE